MILNMHGGKHHGLTVESGVYISRITPGSVAAREGSIAVGDRLLSVSIFHLSARLLYLSFSYDFLILNIMHYLIQFQYE